MEYKSIYRKYRPQKFSEIVGQEDVVKPLKNAVRTGRLAHAYLFCGPRGTGKTSAARILAKAINCRNREKDSAEPCDICDNCKSIREGSNVDVIEFDAASHRSVTDAEDLINRVNYLPNILAKKIYIIDEVHMISDSAFNSLLKTLEEPPEHVIFILATTEPEKIIPTIISRCQRFNFKPIASDFITGKLKTIASAENIDINDAALKLISKYSGGSQRDANVILEKLALIDEKRIKVEDVTALLGVVDSEILFELVNILIEQNVSDALFFEHRLKQSYHNLKVFIEEFVDHLHILFIIKNYESAFEILDINNDYKEKYLDQSKLMTNASLQHYIDVFSNLYKEMKRSEGIGILFRSALIGAVTSGRTTGAKDSAIINDKGYQEKISGLENEIKNIKSLMANFQAGINKIPEIINDKSSSHVQQPPQEKYFEAGDTGSGTVKKANIFIRDKDKKTAGAETTVNPVPSETENSDLNTKSHISGKESQTAAGKASEAGALSASKGEEVKIPSEKLETSHEDNQVEIIKSNWDKICSTIKTKDKGIPLCAMFIEARKIKISKDRIYFYLPDNSKFHKDNLNKAENISKIEASISEATGKSFTVNFFFESEGKDFINLKNPAEIIKKQGQPLVRETESFSSEPVKEIDLIKEQLSSQYMKVKEKPEKAAGDKKDGETTGVNIGDYDYFEKKFEIKEKKGGI